LFRQAGGAGEEEKQGERRITEQLPSFLPCLSELYWLRFPISFKEVGNFVVRVKAQKIRNLATANHILLNRLGSLRSNNFLRHRQESLNVH
jgi:hypothetical protein